MLKILGEVKQGHLGCGFRSHYGEEEAARLAEGSAENGILSTRASRPRQYPQMLLSLQNSPDLRNFWDFPFPILEGLPLAG